MTKMLFSMYDLTNKQNICENMFGKQFTISRKLENSKEEFLFKRKK